MSHRGRKTKLGDKCIVTSHDMLQNPIRNRRELLFVSFSLSLPPISVSLFLSFFRPLQPLCILPHRVVEQRKRNIEKRRARGISTLGYTSDKGAQRRAALANEGVSSFWLPLRPFVRLDGLRRNERNEDGPPTRTNKPRIRSDENQRRDGKGQAGWEYFLENWPDKVKNLEILENERNGLGNWKRICNCRNHSLHKNMLNPVVFILQ